MRELMTYGIYASRISFAKTQNRHVHAMRTMSVHGRRAIPLRISIGASKHIIVKEKGNLTASSVVTIAAENVRIKIED